LAGVPAAVELLERPLTAQEGAFDLHRYASVRSTGFFDGAGSAEHVAVLAVWAVLGLAATLVTRSTHGTLMKPVSSSDG
jgi:hypothetical protein